MSLGAEHRFVWLTPNTGPYIILPHYKGLCSMLWPAWYCICLTRQLLGHWLEAESCCGPHDAQHRGLAWVTIQQISACRELSRCKMASKCQEMFKTGSWALDGKSSRWVSGRIMPTSKVFLLEAKSPTGDPNAEFWQGTAESTRT